jgi:hypothetical protein
MFFLVAVVKEFSIQRHYRYRYRRLVGGLEHFSFSPIFGMMIQSDEVIFFKGLPSGKLT